MSPTIATMNDVDIITAARALRKKPHETQEQYIKRNLTREFCVWLQQEFDRLLMDSTCFGEAEPWRGNPSEDVVF